MTNILEFARKEDKKAEKRGEQPENKREEPLEKVVNDVISSVRTHVGIDISDADVTSLPGDIAGEFKPTDDSITLDEKILQNEGADVIEHVATHEANHKKNKREGDETFIKDTEFNEALIERATERITGKVLSYKDILGKVDRVAAATDTTRSELIDLCERGQNEELNDLHAQAFDSAA